MMNPYEMYTVSKLTSPKFADSNCVYLKCPHPDIKYVLVCSSTTKAPFKLAMDPTLESELHVGLNATQRTQLYVEFGKVVRIESYNEPIVPISSATFHVSCVSSRKKTTIEIDDAYFQGIKRVFHELPVLKQQTLIYKSEVFCLLTEHTPGNIIDENTDIKLFSADPLINIIASSALPPLFKGNFNFLELGIGGLDKQFEAIFRRAFASRLVPEKVLKNLGIHHVRGILLYGPPGCGKTLIARQIGKILNCEEPKIANGPELFSGLVGSSEANVRALFEDAIRDKNGKKLHLIICDEFDSVARHRGSISGDAGSNDKVVNQFLTMIDGPKSLNNILLICMTNRKELIDDALLRPGRLELHIEVSLPDEKGRHDILQIHTTQMESAGYMDSTVNLNELAAKTINYTGAELESVVRNAASFSIAKHIDPENLSNMKFVQPVLNQGDFLRAIAEIKPQFGLHSPFIDTICSKPFELYSSSYASIYSDIREKIERLKTGSFLSILLTGDTYTGKTTLAANVAKECGYSCVRFINSEEMIKRQPNSEKYLYETFLSGSSLESFLIVLDSVEKLIEYSKLGNYANNRVLQVIYSILDRAVTNRTVILLTSSNESIMDFLGLKAQCSFHYELDGISDDQQLISEVFKSRNFN